MFDIRAPLIPLSVAIGLALGAGAWLAAGRQDVLAPVQDCLAALHSVRADGAAGAGASPLSGAPLFALSTGPSAVKDPGVALLGLSRMPGRTAALVAIDGKPAAWLGHGESRDGVVLREVGAGRATFDLPLGLKDLRIGEGTSGSPQASAAALALPQSDGAPPGFRSPPPPASAPGLGG